MNFFKTTILLAVLTAMLVFAGDALGGRSGAITALIFAGIMNFVTYWFSDKIVLMMYRAKPVTEADAPELYAITRDLTMKAGLPMPKVYIMGNDTPNAFATGRNPGHAAVAVTTGIMRLLTREELTGVLAHELAHMAQWAAMFGGTRDNEREGNPIALIVMMIVAPLAAMIIQMAISRSREYGADMGGARICGNPLSLANALRKLEYANKRIPMVGVNAATSHMFIVNPLSGGSLLRLFSTHPPIEERIKRLEAMAGPLQKICFVVVKNQ